MNESKTNQSPSQEKNYITPSGAKMLQDELYELKHDERPKLVETISWAAANGDRSENADYIYGKRRLREIDKRIEFLLKRLDLAEVIDPSTVKSNKVLFGVTVTILDHDQKEKTYKIAGIDEVDLDKNQISWKSPIAAAMLNHVVGDIVTVVSPNGEREVEIIKIVYK
ncbi:MAG: transcription elongation factor GreB [bacterium]|nr:transcription elongation factor GreB [bacterium]